MMESYNLQTDEFTLIAESVLNKVEEEKRLLNAIKKGDMRPFTVVMKSIIKHEFTWGDHLKRYLYQAVKLGQITVQKPWSDMDDWSQDDVIQLLQKIFEENEMEDRELRTNCLPTLRSLPSGTELRFRPTMPKKNKGTFLMMLTLPPFVRNLLKAVS